MSFVKRVGLALTICKRCGWQVRTLEHSWWRKPEKCFTKDPRHHNFTVGTLSHWGRVKHICVNYLIIIIGSDNGLSHGWCQAIIWTNAGILLIGPLGTNFSGILIEIHTFSYKKMHLKISSGKRRPFCLGLSVLNIKVTMKFYRCHNSRAVTVCAKLHCDHMPTIWKAGKYFFFKFKLGYHDSVWKAPGHQCNSLINFLSLITRIIGAESATSHLHIIQSFILFALYAYHELTNALMPSIYVISTWAPMDTLPHDYINFKISNSIKVRHVMLQCLLTSQSINNKYTTNRVQYVQTCYQVYKCMTKYCKTNITLGIGIVYDSFIVDKKLGHRPRKSYFEL